MAKQAELALILSLVDEVSKTAKSVRGELVETGKSAQGLQGVVSGLGKIGFGALAAGAAVATTAVTAIGAAAWKAGHTLDAAYDTIRIQTGATGEQLQALQRDFDAVFANFPGDAETVANTLAAVNMRLGITGVKAQELSLQIAEAARLLGTDAVSSTEKLTRVLGDWGVETDDASATLDTFFKASQVTGAGMEDLMSKVVQFGAPLRLMGFSLNDAIALFGKWEKEGVNSELVMGSLRIAAGKFAKEGEDTAKAIAGMTADMNKARIEATKYERELAVAIQKQAELGDKAKDSARLAAQMKIDDLRDKLAGAQSQASGLASEIANLNAQGKDAKPLRDSLMETFEAIRKTSDETWALSHGMEVFGARAGPDMVAAIREGRFAFEDYLALLEDSQGAIQSAVKDTEDWGEKWAKLKNKLTLALGPIGLAMMDAASVAMDKLAPAFDKLMGLFQSKVVPFAQRAAEAFGLLVGGDINGALETMFGKQRAAQITKWAEAFGQFVDKVKTFVTEHSEELKAALIAIGVVIAAATIASGIMAIAGAIAALANPITLIIAAVALLGYAWSSNWGGIQEKTQAVIEWIKTNVPIALETIKGKWASFSAGVSSVASTTWGGIQTGIGAALEWIKSASGAALDWLRGAYETVLGAIQRFWSAHGEQIMTIVSAIWGWITEKIASVMEIIRTVIDGIQRAIAGDWEGFGIRMREAAGRFLGLLINLFYETPQKIIEAIRPLAIKLAEWFASVDWAQLGKDVLLAVFNGMLSASQALGNMLLTLGEKVATWIKSVDWAQVGKDVLQAIINGMLAGTQLMQDALKGLANAAIGAARGFFSGGSEIPQFASGGVVPGPVGQPRMAVVHGGETITPAGQSGGVTFGPGSIIVYGGTEQTVERGVLNALRAAGVA